MVRKNILFFDVDGCLNGYSDVVARSEILDKIKSTQDDEIKQILNQKREELFPYCPYVNKDGKVTHMGFVSSEKLEKLRNIILKYNVEAIGISSWFILDFEKNKEIFEKFFGFPIKAVGGLVTISDVRSNFALSYLKEEMNKGNLDLNNIRVVYLDDQNDFENAQTLTELSNFQTLFVFPHGAYGLKSHQFDMIETWFK